jgi:hypothetical protein
MNSDYPYERFTRNAMREWRARLDAAFINVANERRKARNLRPVEPARIVVYVPKKTPREESDFRLLNLKVWELRYGVSPEYMLRNLTDDRTLRFEGRVLIYNQPAGRLTSEKSRKAIEAAVARDYPNGEQWRIIDSPPLAQLIPRTRLDLNDPDAFIERYREKIDQLRKDRETEARPSKRPYRTQRWRPNDNQTA